MTEERPTPETDAVDGKPTWQENIIEKGWVPADFARRLECERDEARERADTMFVKHAEILDQYRRERDAALRKLESLEESIASLDHPNIRILLRQAERYALDVAEKHENKYREIKKQLTDNNAERALADRLADALRELCNTFKWKRDISEESLNKAERVLADWVIAFVHRDQYGGQLIDSDCDCAEGEYLEPIDEAPCRMEGGTK